MKHLKASFKYLVITYIVCYVCAFFTAIYERVFIDIKRGVPFDSQDYTNVIKRTHLLDEHTNYNMLLAFIVFVPFFLIFKLKKRKEKLFLKYAVYSLVYSMITSFVLVILSGGGGTTERLVVNWMVGILANVSCLLLIYFVFNFLEKILIKKK